MRVCLSCDKEVRSKNKETSKKIFLNPEQIYKFLFIIVHFQNYEWIFRFFFYLEEDISLHKQNCYFLWKERKQKKTFCFTKELISFFIICMNRKLKPWKCKVQIPSNKQNFFSYQKAIHYDNGLNLLRVS